MKKQNNSQITDRNDLEQLAVEWETFSTEYAAALAEKDRRIAEFAEKENKKFLAVYSGLLEKKEEYAGQILNAIKENPQWFNGKKKSFRKGTVSYGIRTLPRKCIINNENELRTYADKLNLPFYSTKIKWLDAAIRKHWNDVEKDIPGVEFKQGEEITFLRSDLLS